MPKVAAIAVALVAAVVLAVVLTRPGGNSGGGGEIFLQAADETGPDPFTESTAKRSSPPSSTPAAEPGDGTSDAHATRSVEGSEPGLYAGTRKVASCDVEKQVTALSADAGKNRAFARVQKIEPSGVPAYLRSLTPVQLRMDTRVTNHGYKDGEPRAYQAVLQAGTAVMVDDRGLPRVRCACGNPLLPPVAQQDPRTTGDPWPGYRASNVVVVAPADRPVKEFVLRDGDGWIERPAGDTGTHDRKTEPPARDPSPSTSTSPSDGGGTAPPDDRDPPSSGPPEPPEEPQPEPPTTGDEPAPEEPSGPVRPEEPAPDSGADSPDGPTPPEEPPGRTGGENGSAPGLTDPARAPVLGTVLV